MSDSINLVLGHTSNNPLIRLCCDTCPDTHRLSIVESMFGNQLATQEKPKKKWPFILPFFAHHPTQKVNIIFINQIEKTITLLLRHLFIISSLFAKHEKVNIFNINKITNKKAESCRF